MENATFCIAAQVWRFSSIALGSHRRRLDPEADSCFPRRGSSLPPRKRQPTFPPGVKVGKCGSSPLGIHKITVATDKMKAPRQSIRITLLGTEVCASRCYGIIVSGKLSSTVEYVRHPL